MIHEAVDKRIREVEIIPGRGSGQLKKRVLKFLERPDIKQLYHRVDKDSKNPGRLLRVFPVLNYAGALDALISDGEQGRRNHSDTVLAPAGFGSGVDHDCIRQVIVPALPFRKA